MKWEKGTLVEWMLLSAPLFTKIWFVSFLETVLKKDCVLSIDLESHYHPMIMQSLSRCYGPPTQLSLIVGGNGITMKGQTSDFQDGAFKVKLQCRRERDYKLNGTIFFCFEFKSKKLDLPHFYHQQVNITFNHRYAKETLDWNRMLNL